MTVNASERRGIEVFDIKCLRKALWENVMEQIRNRDIKERCEKRRNSWSEWTQLQKAIWTHGC